MMVPFGVRQFRRLLAGCMLVNGCTFLASMMGNSLAGWCLGEQGLAGVALAVPLTTVANMRFVCAPCPVKPGIDRLDEQFRQLLIFDAERLRHGQVIMGLDDDAMELYGKAWDRIRGR